MCPRLVIFNSDRVELWILPGVVGLYWDDGKANGSYYSITGYILGRAYIRVISG